MGTVQLCGIHQVQRIHSAQWSWDITLHGKTTRNATLANHPNPLQQEQWFFSIFFRNELIFIFISFTLISVGILMSVFGLVLVFKTGNFYRMLFIGIFSLLMGIWIMCFNRISQFVTGGILLQHSPWIRVPFPRTYSFCPSCTFMLQKSKGLANQDAQVERTCLYFLWPCLLYPSCP